MNINENYVFPVYIYEYVLKEIKQLCKASKLEIFGYLSGNISKWKEKIYILIEDQLFIKGAVHSNQFSTSQIRGTAGKYEEKFQKLRLKRKNNNLRIVGWWHSHPGFGCFLSKTDLHTQEFFFPQSYQVALVVDPVKNIFNFFNIDKNSSKGYKKISYAIISSQ